METDPNWLQDDRRWLPWNEISGVLLPTERNFRCPLTDSACINPRCRRDQCAQSLDDEAVEREIQARKREIQRQELNDPKYHKAAIRVLEARVSWLNSQGTKQYFFPSPYGMPGLEREAAKNWREELIYRLLTSSKHRSLVRAVVAGRPISHGSFAKDEDLDDLFGEVLSEI
jgi:hypothetical protein